MSALPVSVYYSKVLPKYRIENLQLRKHDDTLVTNAEKQQLRQLLVDSKLLDRLLSPPDYVTCWLDKTKEIKDRHYEAFLLFHIIWSSLPKKYVDKFGNFQSPFSHPDMIQHEFYFRGLIASDRFVEKADPTDGFINFMESAYSLASTLKTPSLLWDERYSLSFITFSIDNVDRKFNRARDLAGGQNLFHAFATSKVGDIVWARHVFRNCELLSCNSADVYGVVSENEGRIYLSPWKQEWPIGPVVDTSLELWYSFPRSYNVTELYRHFYAAVLIQKTWRMRMKRRIQERTRLIQDELMVVAWNPDRVRQCIDEDSVQRVARFRL